MCKTRNLTHVGLYYVVLWVNLFLGTNRRLEVVYKRMQVAVYFHKRVAHY
jgi:hypothetical protein